MDEIRQIHIVRTASPSLQLLKLTATLNTLCVFLLTLVSPRTNGNSSDNSSSLATTSSYSLSATDFEIPKGFLYDKPDTVTKQLLIQTVDNQHASLEFVTDAARSIKEHAGIELINDVVHSVRTNTTGLRGHYSSSETKHVNSSTNGDISTRKRSDLTYVKNNSKATVGLIKNRHNSKPSTENETKTDNSTDMSPPEESSSSKEMTPLFTEVNFTEQVDMSSCLQNHGHINAFVDKLQIYYSHGLDMGGPGHSITRLMCKVTASTSQEKRFSVRLKGKTCEGFSDFVRVFMSDEHHVKHWSFGVSGFEPKAFRSVGNKVTVVVKLGDSSVDYNIAFGLFAVASRLKVIQLSTTQGFIQTPGNDKMNSYWDLMDTWEDIHPPSDHVTLLSMSRFNVICPDIVEVYDGGTASENLEWDVCGQYPPAPRLLDTRVIYVHFRSDHEEEAAGFRLSFSYHPSGHHPSQINNGTWNCSVPEWPEFERHFLCNLEMECAGGEDEARCFYTGHCGPGHLTLDNRCYTYLSPKRPVSWEEANVACVALGGYLVSMNTPRETRIISEFLTGRANMRTSYIGAKVANIALPFMYRHTWQWADGSIAFYARINGVRGPNCPFFHSITFPTLVQIPCFEAGSIDLLCEFDPRPSSDHASVSPNQTTSAIRFASLSEPDLPLPVPYIECPEGHLTHDFLACDEQSVCWQSRRVYEEIETWGIPSRMSCPAPMTSLPAMFTCSSSLQRVPYSMVCDHRQQCMDGSDESLCIFPPCSEPTPTECATSFQCVERNMYCDSIEQCVDHSDESDCEQTVRWATFHPIPPPAVISYDPTRSGFRYLRITPRHEEETPASLCPHTHFQCPGDGYCLPSFLHCNDVVDCPGREDEVDCEVFTCPGYYRCRSSMVCLHVSFVCDGVPQCPQQDDELYCHSPACPLNCTCHGLAFTCSGIFRGGSHPALCYLNGKGSGLGFRHLPENTMLAYLNLADCGVRVLRAFFFPNLRIMDLSDNLITVISVEQISSFVSLQVFIISGNPIADLFSADPNGTLTLNHLELMVLSRMKLEEIDFSHFACFPNLKTLNMSNSTVGSLHRSDKRSMGNVQVLNLRSCHVKRFQHDIISSLANLETVYTEDYKLCCPMMLPLMFNPKNCHAPMDRVSSCDNLLSSGLHRAVLSVCCSLALLGNVISIIVRVFVSRCSNSTSTDVFVTHLALADIVMGVCVAVVVLVDRLYQGRHVLVDTFWRDSIMCSVVGFLFLLSSQLSVTVVFLVAFNGMLSLCSTTWRLSFKPTSSHAVCTIVWIANTVVVLLPLLPNTRFSGFYCQTSICIPLLVTKEQYSQEGNATFAMFVVVFSFLLTIFTAVSQIAIYITSKSGIANMKFTRSLHGSSLTTLSAKSHDIVHARRVFSSCVLNVVCWLSLCVLAVPQWLASPVSDELNLHLSMISMPVASALRPFLYAMAIREERRKRERTEMLMTRIAAQRRCIE